MSKISADKLREVLVALIIENAQLKAETGPVIMPAHLDLEELPKLFDAALHEFNDYRANAGLDSVEPDGTFKQAVVDSIVQRFESVGRVVVGQ